MIKSELSHQKRKYTKPNPAREALEKVHQQRVDFDKEMAERHRKNLRSRKIARYNALPDLIGSLASKDIDPKWTDLRQADLWIERQELGDELNYEKLTPEGILKLNKIKGKQKNDWKQWELQRKKEQEKEIPSEPFCNLTLLLDLEQQETTIAQELLRQPDEIRIALRKDLLRLDIFVHKKLPEKVELLSQQLKQNVTKNQPAIPGILTSILTSLLESGFKKQ